MDFQEILMENPETKSLQYASDMEQYNNLSALGWTEYKGNRSKFGPGKDVPWGSTTETFAGEVLPASDAPVTTTSDTDTTTTTQVDSATTVTETK